MDDVFMEKMNAVIDSVVKLEKHMGDSEGKFQETINKVEDKAAQDFIRSSFAKAKAGKLNVDQFMKAAEKFK